MKTELRYSWPSAEGVNPEYIVNFLNACEKADSEIHGIMIARHGNVIFEAYNAPYAAEIPHIMHSFTKTLTNTAVALAYDDGLLGLDNPILKYFPEYEPEANEYLKKCPIRNMITMRNGQERSVGGNEWRPLKTSWKDAYFKIPFDKEPGKTFMYSSGNSYILSYIVQKLTGKTCRELVQERVGKEIGLTDFPWMLSPEGVCSGGNGVSLTTGDMLRIGLLYLNKGKWNGKQLISEEWIDHALGYTDPLDPVDGLQYNFHWDHAGDIWAARGMFGQTCGLVPALDMVFAVTAADSGYQAMKLFQKEVIDPVKENDGRLITDGTMDDVLKQKALRMTLEGKNCSVPGHKEILRKMTWTPENHVDGIRKIELCPAEGKNLIYRMEDDRGVHEIHAGLDHWIHGTTTMTGAYLHHQYEQPVSKIAAIAYWTAPDVLMMEWRYPEMAFWDHVTLTWDHGDVRMDRWVNMNSQDLKRPTVCMKEQ